MKNIFLALVAILMAHSATAQENYPQGIYMSLEEIVSKTPSVKDSAQIIKLKGCPNDRNDYVLKSEDKKTKKAVEEKSLGLLKRGHSISKRLCLQSSERLHQADKQRQIHLV
jgi:hypothetical protein